MSRHDLAKHIGMSLRTIDNLTSRGALPFFKLGKSVRFSWPDVEEALQERFKVATKAATKSK